MKKKILPISIILIFGLIFIVFYKGLQDSNIYTPDANIKNDIPIFNTKDFYSDETINSFGFFKVDKNYLLNIWSSWCVPCRQEHKFLMVLNEENKINLIGLNYKDNKKKAKKFLDELGNPYNKFLLI